MSVNPLPRYVHSNVLRDPKCGTSQLCNVTQHIQRRLPISDIVVMMGVLNGKVSSYKTLLEYVIGNQCFRSRHCARFTVFSAFTGLSFVEYSSSTEPVVKSVESQMACNDHPIILTTWRSAGDFGVVFWMCKSWKAWHHHLPSLLGAFLGKGGEPRPLKLNMARFGSWVS